jgi:hypothetical protein
MVFPVHGVAAGASQRRIGRVRYQRHDGHLHHRFAEPFGGAGDDSLPGDIRNFQFLTRDGTPA